MALQLERKVNWLLCLEILRTVFAQYVSMRSANKEVVLEAVYVWLQPRLPFSIYHTIVHFIAHKSLLLHINPINLRSQKLTIAEEKTGTELPIHGGAWGHWLSVTCIHSNTFTNIHCTRGTEVIINL